MTETAYEGEYFDFYGRATMADPERAVEVLESIALMFGVE